MCFILYRIKILTLLIVTMAPCGLSGQKIMNTPITKIGQINNNSLANVRAISKDKYGFMWIGTQDGLFRYDGFAANVYNRGTSDLPHRILNNDVSALLCSDDDDFLWVLNSFMGISKIELLTGIVKEKFQISTPGGKSENFTITRMIEYKGSLYVSAEEGNIFKFSKSTGRLEMLGKIENLLNRKIEQLCRLGDQFIVCFGGGMLMLFDSAFRAPLARLSINPTQQDFHFNKYCYNDQNELVLATTVGARKIKVLRMGQQYSLVDSGVAEINLSADIQSISFKDSSYWVSDNNTIYRFFLNGEKYKYKTSKGPDDQKWLNAVKVISFSGDEVWNGNEYGVSVIKVSTPPFIPYYQGDNITTKLNHCNNLLAVNDSVLYSCATDGFYKINTNSGTIGRIGDNTYSLSAFVGPGKEIVFSNDKATYIINENSQPALISRKYKELNKLDYDLIAASANYKDSLLFMASQYERGLHVYDIKHKRLSNINTNTFPLALKTNVINSLYIRGNVLWIVCDNAVSSFDIPANKLTNYTIYDPATRLPLNIIMDICFVKDKIWLAVYGVGLVEMTNQFQIKNIYAVSAGLQNLGLYKIYNVGDSMLLTTSNNGLYRLNLATGKIKAFFEEDGLHGNAFEESGGTMINNRLIVGGVNGFTIIDPQKFRINAAPPKIYFSKISIERPGTNSDTANLEIKKITIPNDVLQTVIHLSAINFTSSHNVAFAWRIVENNTEWTANGSQNFIQLIGLPHGTYHLQVKTANEDGVWSEPKELVLVFLPKWYQTWWFYLLIALTAAGILYALYRYRISQIKKQHEIRKNIATDLHDDLGSTLNSVKVFTNLAISGVKQEESLQQIKDNLNEATMGLRDMIWVLDDSLDTVDELVTRLKQFAIPVASASNIQAEIKAESEVNSLKLTKEEKRNLFLVCKEAINNSIKYSGATQIDVDIKPDGKKIRIAIADNGKGFNVNEVKKGYGLKNMQYRAGQVKYKTTLVSSPGKGTQVEIRPL